MQHGVEQSGRPAREIVAVQQRKVIDVGIFAGLGDAGLALGIRGLLLAQFGLRGRVETVENRWHGMLKRHAGAAASQQQVHTQRGNVIGRGEMPVDRRRANRERRIAHPRFVRAIAPQMHVPGCEQQRPRARP